MNPSTTTMQGQVLAMLLDSAPQTWHTREELQLRLSCALIQRGVRPLLIFSEDPSEEIREKYLAHGVEVLPSINYEKGLFNFCRQLSHIVKNYSVTGVHLVFFSYFSLIPWMARLCGVRYIVHQERNSGILRAKSWKKRLLQFRTMLTTRPINKVITISHFVGRQLAEVGVRKEKIVVVHHGVDICRFSPDEYARARLVDKFAIQPDEVILSTVSYLRPFKNVQVILQACGLLAKGGVDAQLFVAGDGDIRNELEALTHRLGIVDRVHWLGNVTDPKPLLQGSDIYVMASVGEAFGMALVEAMACGAAVVASRSGAFSEIVEDGKSGLLVPPLDPLALADAVEKLARDGKLRGLIAKNGIERVRQHFMADRSIDKIIGVYESMWAPS